MLALETYRPSVPYRRMPQARPAERLTQQQVVGRALRRLRKRAGLTQEEAAVKADVVVQSWRRYEAGARDLSIEKIIELVEPLGFNLDAFLREREAAAEGATETGSQAGAPAPPRVVSLPIRDRVQAGAWLAADDSVQAVRTYPEAPDPRFPRARQWLSEVNGDSVDLLRIFDGDLVKVVDAEEIGYAPRTGDVLEVERLRFGGRERELTIKQVEVTADGVLLWPRSSNPRHRDPLELRQGTGEDEEVVVIIRGLVLTAIRRLF